MKKDLIRIILLSLLVFTMSASLATATPKDNTKEFDIENAGMLTGQAVFEDGKPIPYGFVSFFAIDPSMSEHQDYGVSKRSPKMVSFIKQDGAFETMLFPAGKYFVGAVMTKRWIGGPPKKGQKRFSAIDDQGKYMIVEVKAAETADVGTLIFKDPDQFPEREKKFTIMGRVLDEKGAGVPGSVVVAKNDINDP
jgi:hypothetical protein